MSLTILNPLELLTVLCYNTLRITCGISCHSVAGLHKRGCISKRISKKFLEIFLEIGIPYGVRDFSRFEQKRAESPCKHWVFSFFYRRLSSRKIRQIPMGDCALKTVCPPGHVSSNLTLSATKSLENITFSRLFIFISIKTTGSTSDLLCP